MSEYIEDTQDDWILMLSNKKFVLILLRQKWMEFQQVTRTRSTGEALLVQGRDEVKIFIIFLFISCDDYFC